MSMNEKIETLYWELFSYMKVVTERVTDGVATPAEAESVPEVARVLIDLINLQSAM